MQPVPKTPKEALEVFRSPNSEDWERDYAVLMIGTLDEALPDLVAMACDPTVSEMLQQRAAEALGGAWRDRGRGRLAQARRRHAAGVGPRGIKKC